MIKVNLYKYSIINKRMETRDSIIKKYNKSVYRTITGMVAGVILGSAIGFVGSQMAINYELKPLETYSVIANKNASVAYGGLALLVVSGVAGMTRLKRISIKESEELEALSNS